MSCWTSLTLYRPTSPPQITGSALGAFVRAFAKLGVTDALADLDATIKFGDAVDQDDRPSTWEEFDSPGSLISTLRTLSWDLAVERGSLIDTAAFLEQSDRNIYRAHIPLGSLAPGLAQRFMRPATPEEPRGLHLSACSLSIGPVLLANLASDSTFFGGWLSISFEGNGQIWPWTTHELVRKAESSFELRRLMDLCRQTWPVSSLSATDDIQAFRRQMGDLWPYMDRDRPVDWHWSTCEG